MAAGAPLRVPPSIDLAPKEKTPTLLLQSASKGADHVVSALYGQMVELVGPEAPAGPRRAFLEELNTGKGCDEPIDFFHVAIDLPGFGASRASLQARRKAEDPIATSDFLADVIKSCGKHFA